MILAYATRTGNVKSIIDRLGVKDVVDVNTTDKVDKDFIIFTYTDGFGDVPYEVEEFLENNSSHLKGVVASGSKHYESTFCMAGDEISQKYNVPLLYKVDESGTEEDIKNILNIINNL